MSNTWLDLQFNLEASRLEQGGRKGRRQWRDGREKAGVANHGGDFPSARRDSVKSDNRSLGDADKRKPIEFFFVPLALDDLIDRSIECVAYFGKAIRPKLIAVNLKPEMTGSFGFAKWRVWCGEPGSRKTCLPGRGERHHLRARGTDAVEKNDKSFCRSQAR